MSLSGWASQLLPSVGNSLSLFVHPSTHQSTYPSIYPFITPFTSPSIHPSFCPSICNMSVLHFSHASPDKVTVMSEYHLSGCFSILHVLTHSLTPFSCMCLITERFSIYLTTHMPQAVNNPNCVMAQSCLPHTGSYPLAVSLHTGTSVCRPMRAIHAVVPVLLFV